MEWQPLTIDQSCRPPWWEETCHGCSGRTFHELSNTELGANSASYQ